VLDSNLSVEEEMKILAEKNIRCAPVWSLEKKGFIGVLDIRDSLKHAVKVYRQNKSTNSSNTSKDGNGNENENENDSPLISLPPEVMTDKLSYFARMRPFRTLQDNDDIISLLGALSRGSHLIGITYHKTKKLIGILSQGETFQQISAYYSKLKLDVSLLHLQMYGYVKSPVICVPTTILAHEAFELMEKHGLSGLAVVNSNQEIVHNTSSTDIKLWLQSKAALGLTIEDFLVKIRSSGSQQKKVGFAVTYATNDSSFRAVVDMFIKTKYHRIWVVDESKHPIGVISLTDIFKLITNDFKPLIASQPDVSKNPSLDENEEES